MLLFVQRTMEADTMISTLFCLLSVCALLVSLVPTLQPIANHGKCTRENIKDNNILMQWCDIRVPKYLFGWMYVYGLVTGIACFVYFPQVASISQSQFAASNLPELVLYEIHCLRRMLECLLMTHFGTSTMHIAGFLVGLVHYTLVPLCLVLNHGNTYKKTYPYSIFVLSLILYILGSIVQSHAHYVLFVIKRKDKSKHKHNQNQSRYAFPTGGGFEYIAAPHYAAEIVIYFSWFVCGGPSVAKGWMAFWVISNLSVVADAQYRWYRENFPEEFKSKTKNNQKKSSSDNGKVRSGGLLPWKRLIPGIW